MSDYLIREILQDYSRQRAENQRALRQRRAELYESLPDLREIDAQMAKIGRDISEAILQEPEKTDSLLQELKATLDALKSEKAVLLTDHGISPQYLELEYRCEKCKDTGYLDDQTRCQCLNQRLVSAAYKMSNIEKQLEKQNFNHFDLNVFSSQILPKEQLTQRENMKIILAETENFVDTFPNGKNILMYGTSGLGKTFLCNCIAKALIDRGHTVIYQTPFSIIQLLERRAFTDRGNAFVQMAYDQLFSVDLLIIDDLGTEVPNSFTIGEFYNIINARILAEKSTVLSTNIKLSEIRTLYNDRIDSRIKGHYQLLKFFGPDVRWETRRNG
jgi:DNA replication protein DnaC